MITAVFPLNTYNTDLDRVPNDCQFVHHVWGTQTHITSLSKSHTLLWAHTANVQLTLADRWWNEQGSEERAVVFLFKLLRGLEKSRLTTTTPDWRFLKRHLTAGKESMISKYCISKRQLFTMTSKERHLINSKYHWLKYKTDAFNIFTWLLGKIQVNLYLK